MFEKYEKFGAEKLNIRSFELNALSIFLICLILASVYKYFSDRSLSFEKKKALFAAIDSISKTNSSSDILDEIELANNRIKLEDSKNNKFIIDINTASHLELMKLPSIGEKTAKLIIDFRNKNGHLKNEDLLDVKGIGNKTYEKILPFLKQDDEKDSISKGNLKERKENSTNTIKDSLNRLDNTVKDSKEKKKIDLNSANHNEIIQLDGVGEVIAKRIIEYRANQKFEKIEDLMKIQGISKKKFDKVKNFIEIR